MRLRGEHLVAGVAERGAGEPFAAVDPVAGVDLPPVYQEASPAQIDRAAAAAQAAALPEALEPELEHEEAGCGERTHGPQSSRRRRRQPSAKARRGKCGKKWMEIGRKAGGEGGIRTHGGT